MVILTLKTGKRAIQPDYLEVNSLSIGKIITKYLRTCNKLFKVAHQFFSIFLASMIFVTFWCYSSVISSPWLYVCVYRSMISDYLCLFCQDYTSEHHRTQKKQWMMNREILHHRRIKDKVIIFMYVCIHRFYLFIFLLKYLQVKNDLLYIIN